MKTIKRQKKQIVRSIMALALTLGSIALKAQQNVNFTYTVGLNGTVAFNAYSTSTTLVTYLYWSFGDGSFVYNTLSPTHIYQNNGVYQAKLHYLDSSSNPVNSLVMHHININLINPVCNPTVNYSLIQDSLTPLTWKAFPSYPMNTIGATWSWGDGSVSNGLYPSHTYSAAGWYNTCVTISVSCGTNTATFCDSSYVYRPLTGQNKSMISLNVLNTKLSTGIPKNKSISNSDIKLFPNPSGNAISISLNSTNNAISEIKVFSSLGQEVLTRQEKTFIGSNLINIDLGELQKGIYYVSVTNGNDNYKALRLIKN